MRIVHASQVVGCERHPRQVLHRDLKPANLLLAPTPGAPPQLPCPTDAPMTCPTDTSRRWLGPAHLRLRALRGQAPPARQHGRQRARLAGGKKGGCRRAGARLTTRTAHCESYSYLS
jgi:serine/threonine protein kinase